MKYLIFIIFLIVYSQSYALKTSIATKYMNITNSADKAVKLILMNQSEREQDASSVCFTKLWKAK